MPKRGEIYFDPAYRYPAGNVEDKLLIILNKVCFPFKPIIAVPVTTNKSDKKYHFGCNHKSGIFYIKAGDDFFENNTVVQLFILNSAGTIPEDVFSAKVKAKTIERRATLKSKTIDSLIKCIEQTKDDISEELHQYLF